MNSSVWNYADGGESTRIIPTFPLLIEEARLQCSKIGTGCLYVPPYVL